jgi:DNA-binding XRE family transcriptional regulator
MTTYKNLIPRRDLRRRSIRRKISRMATQAEDIYEPWGVVFREGRERKGWSQREASRQLGIPLRTIQFWEQDKDGGNPTWSHIQICALGFGWGGDFLRKHILRYLNPPPDQHKHPSFLA